MSDVLVSHVAALPWEPDLVAVGAHERRVEVWSLARLAPLAVMDTVLDFGGQRLALVTDGQAEPVVVAGAWARHGVCGHALSGERIWQYRERSQVQYVTALAGGRVAVGFERGPATVLDAATGRPRDELRAVVQVVALTPEMVLLVSRTHVQVTGADLVPRGSRVALRSFSVLDAAAGDGLVALAEAAGDLRFLRLDGSERAAYPVPGGHVRRVAFDASTGTWRALTSVDQGDRVGCALIRLTPDGELLEQRPLDSVTDAAWLRDGAALVYVSERGVFLLADDEVVPLRLTQPDTSDPRRD